MSFNQYSADLDDLTAAVLASAHVAAAGQPGARIPATVPDPRPLARCKPVAKARGSVSESVAQSTPKQAAPPPLKGTYVGGLPPWRRAQSSGSAREEVPCTTTSKAPAEPAVQYPSLAHKLALKRKALCQEELAKAEEVLAQYSDPTAKARGGQAMARIALLRQQQEQRMADQQQQLQLAKGSPAPAPPTPAPPTPAPPALAPAAPAAPTPAPPAAIAPTQPAQPPPPQCRPDNLDDDAWMAWAEQYNAQQQRPVAAAAAACPPAPHVVAPRVVAPRPWTAVAAVEPPRTPRAGAYGRYYTHLTYAKGIGKEAQFRSRNPRPASKEAAYDWKLTKY